MSIYRKYVCILYVRIITILYVRICLRILVRVCLCLCLCVCVCVHPKLLNTKTAYDDSRWSSMGEAVLPRTTGKGSQVLYI